MELLKIQELLYQSFDFFNDKLCLGSLPKPIITILSRGRKKTTLGWMWKNKWQSDQEIQHEISIMAEALDRPFEDVVETMLHEMAHLYNCHAKVMDCNELGRHNKKFKKTAESIFKLVVTNCPKRGWAYTALTDESKAIIAEFKEKAIITEWKLKRLDAEKKIVDKVYTVTVSEEVKEWLKEQAEIEGVKVKELVADAMTEFKQRTKMRTMPILVDIQKTPILDHANM